MENSQTNPISRQLLREKLVKAIEEWKESVRCIAHGWDCEEEYCEALRYREKLDRVIDRYAVCGIRLPKKLRKCIQRVDEKFRVVTVKSRLCIWDTEAKLDLCHGPVTLAAERYDRERYWYYYRWPPDAPRAYLSYDVYQLQKQCYGLDILGMTQEELKKAAEELIEAMEEMKSPSKYRKYRSQTGVN